MLKKWIYPTGLIIAVFLAFFIYRKYNVAPTIQLAELNLSELNGAAIRLESFRGKKIALCFGASWCGNCIEELNVLKSIKADYLNDVEVIVVSDEPIEKIIRFKEKYSYPFTFLKMNQRFGEIGINSIPATYLVNTKLEVKKETVGYLNWEDPSTLQHLIKSME